jgi:aminoglycoside phosphotransferase family enzyme/predicted kinase
VIAEAPPPKLVLAGQPVDAAHETHISRVYLAGDRAFKVKKPLVLPYLDYGTPARRRAMCRAEVALNRRLAPDIYLGVRSLVPGPDDRLRIGAEDDPDAVDYAVEMRRYRDEATLAARLAAGAAGAAELTAVGARLARFHADAEPDIRQDGGEAVKRALDDNFASLRSLVRRPVERRAIARAERFAAAFLTLVWDELDHRAAAGRVLNGHGDLRLEHVLLEHGVEVVDCVEFDDGLRRIDVAADLAFLVMELHEARRADLAAVLVRAYRDAGGDPGSDALLAFLAAYRALVRAKVALTRAGQLDTGSPERDHASALLRLGERLQWAARTPLVLVVAGLSASGKTTLSRQLAAASGFSHLNSDVVRKRLGGLGPTDRAPLSLYGPESSRATYAELGRRAAESAPGGVIVDATFRSRPDRESFRAELGDRVPVLVVEFWAPVRTLEARARARAGDPDGVSDAGLDVVRRQLATREPLDELDARDHLPLRSDRPPDELVALIADALDRRLLDQ